MTRGRHHDSPDAIRHRLEGWRECLRTGQPYWLVEFAPIVIAQLEADLEKLTNREQMED